MAVKNQLDIGGCRPDRQTHQLNVTDDLVGRDHPERTRKTKPLALPASVPSSPNLQFNTGIESAIVPTIKEEFFNKMSSNLPLDADRSKVRSGSSQTFCPPLPLRLCKCRYLLIAATHANRHEVPISPLVMDAAPYTKGETNLLGNFAGMCLTAPSGVIAARRQRLGQLFPGLARRHQTGQPVRYCQRDGPRPIAAILCAADIRDMSRSPYPVRPGQCSDGFPHTCPPTASPQPHVARSCGSAALSRAMTKGPPVECE